MVRKRVERSKFPNQNKLINLSDKLTELASEVEVLESNYHISTAVIDFDNIFENSTERKQREQGEGLLKCCRWKQTMCTRLDNSTIDMARSMEMLCPSLEALERLPAPTASVPMAS